MKVIAFYSFKGGTGRSLAAAQLAVVLARLGVSVCLWDFDFQAPSLQYKLANARKDMPKRVSRGRGAASYILEAVKASEKEKLSSLRQISILVPNPDTENGNILFVPAGDIEDREYWATVTNVSFQNRFRLAGEDDIEFFEKMKTLTGRLDPAPEFLIIDARSGAGEFPGIGTRLLADDETIVLFTGTSPDSVVGTKGMLNTFVQAQKDKAEWIGNLEKAKAKGDEKEVVILGENRVFAPKHISLVLSRLPQYQAQGSQFHWYTDDELGRVTRRTAEDLGMTSPALLPVGLKMFILYSEPSLLMEEHFVIPLSGEVEQCPLTVGYLSLFSDLAPKYEADFLGLKPAIEELRPYFVVVDEGRLVNPEDQSWNVAFRRDTITSTFDRLYQEIYEREYSRTKDKKLATKAAADALFETGVSAAEEFGSYAGTGLREVADGQTLSDEETIRKWCEFDSRVGFGKFRAVFDAKGRSGEIRLVNNFLTANRAPEEANLCSFMTGYITRVLQGIYDTENVKVEHSPENCSQQGKPACVFRFNATGE